ncbi:MAG: 1-acyl-sn-glycerol-3-phosphate acyltransferase, partial [Gemmatimonas sp.]
CSPRTLMKGEKWWQIPERRPHFHLAVGDDIAVQAFSSDDESPALAVRRLTAYLEQYFTTPSPAHAIS